MVSGDRERGGCDIGFTAGRRYARIVKISKVSRGEARKTAVDVNEQSKGSQASSSKIYDSSISHPPPPLSLSLARARILVHIGIDGFTSANFTTK